MFLILGQDKLLQLVLTNATLNPTKEWIIQQIRNCEMDGFIFLDALVHDRDKIFGNYFDKILADEFFIEPIATDFKNLGKW